MNRLWKKWTGKEVSCSSETAVTSSATDSLGLKNVFMAFLILAGAMVLVAAILAAEIRYYSVDPAAVDKASKYLCVKRSFVASREEGGQSHL